MDCDVLEEALFVKGIKGIVLEDKQGYRYYRHTMKKSKIYWRCSDFSKCKCGARAITKDIYVMSWSGVHNHKVPYGL